jgi:beta-lactamase class A
MSLAPKFCSVAAGLSGWLLLSTVAIPTIAIEQPLAILQNSSIRAYAPTQGQPLNVLQHRLLILQASRYAGLQAGIAILDLETGNYLSINGDRVYATASIIKVPILIALFRGVEGGAIRLTESLTMTRDMMVGGSGNMQYQKVNSQFSVLETATRMITISDNTATNMIIKRLGGMQALNDQFRRWGLQQTRMQNLLPDRFGTNVTTPNELVKLLAMLDRQQLLSVASQRQVFDIMSRVQNRTLLPAGLGAGAAIAHKTGDIGSVQGDAGIIRMPSGKRYLAVMLVARDRTSASPTAFIQAASRLVYSYLSQPATTARLNE